MADAKGQRPNIEKLLLAIYRNTRPPKREWLRYLLLSGCVAVGVIVGGAVLIEIQMWRARAAVDSKMAELDAALGELPFTRR